MTLAKPGTGEVITEARTGDLLPPSAQTSAAGRFRGARRRLAGGRRWSLQRREAGARAGRAGGGAAAGPGACARTSHSAARGRPLASWGRRPARAIRPTPTRRLRRVPNGEGPRLLRALGAYSATGGGPGRSPAPRGRAASPAAAATARESSCERPEAARRRPPRRPAVGEEGDGTDLCPPEARLLPRARGRRRPRAEGGMSRRLPRALGPEGRGSAASYASELRRLGRRARVRRGQRRPLWGSRPRG